MFRRSRSALVLGPTLAVAITAVLLLVTAGPASAALNCTSSGHTDDFSGSSLGGAWTALNFSGGPTYSLASNSGCLRVAIPSGAPHDQWTGVDNAPEVRRTDMGSGNFEVETHLKVESYTEGDPFHGGLMVRFGSGDILLWGPVGGIIKLEASRSGTSDLTKFTQWNHAEVYLKIQKSGTVFTFFHKAAAADRWVSDGQYRASGSPTVASIGLLVKTWTSSGAAATIDFDYFNLVTGTSNSDDCNSTGSVDTFGNIFQRYVPLAGPLISIPPNIPGQGTKLKCLRFDVPGDRAYDHWTSVDNAPQLQRVDMGSGDWTIETEANLVLYSGGSFHTGLMVRFGQYDVYYWGFDNNTDIQLDRSGTAGIVRVTNSSARIWLRVQKTGTSYQFAYKTSSAGSWTTATTQTTSSSVQSVGLIAKTWAANAVAVDFNYFTLTLPSPVAGATCGSFGHSDDLSATTLTSSWTSYVPLTGPTYSLSSSPGCLRWTVPNNQAYDHWTSVDHAPQFQRTDMGSADWLIEARIRLVSNQGTAFHAGLLVWFSQFDAYYWGFNQGTNLQLDRSGSANLVSATNTSPVVSLRIEKSGTTYTFSYRRPGELAWTTAGTQTGVSSTVGKVGLIAKTWQTVGLTLDIDYFDLYKVDNFDGGSLNSAWTQYIPVSGPTFTVSSGNVRIGVPATQAYDHWTSVDNAPQLRRSDMGSADWAIEAKATAVTTSGAFHTGLFVRFSQYDLFYWGFDIGTNLQLDRSGQIGLVKVTNTATTVFLRIEKVGSTYNFLYKLGSSDPWIFAGARAQVSGTPTHVGLITKTWQANAVTSDYDWVKLQPRAGS